MRSRSILHSAISIPAQVSELLGYLDGLVAALHKGSLLHDCQEEVILFHQKLRLVGWLPVLDVGGLHLDEGVLHVCQVVFFGLKQRTELGSPAHEGLPIERSPLL